VRSTALFEIGTVFREVEPRERRMLGFAMTGPAGVTWDSDGRDLDFFDGKGVLEALLEGLGIADPELSASTEPVLHPVRSADVASGGVTLGYVGELHPRVAATFDLEGHRVVIGELSVDSIEPLIDRDLAVNDIPRFPEARRDLAFAVDVAVPAQQVGGVIAREAGELAGTLLLFDVFTGSPVAEGRKSLAFNVGFRASDRTLTDEEVDEVVARIAASLNREFGADLRA
jgi:phenylalanyl-tRNA synthetase beta chain